MDFFTHMLCQYGVSLLYCDSVWFHCICCVVHLCEIHHLHHHNY